MSDPEHRFGFPVVDLPASAASGPEAAVQFLVGELVKSGRLPPEHAARVSSQVLRRELLGSTGIGRGVAVPHSRSDVVPEVLGVVGRSAVPVNWPGALDGGPVHLVCLLVTPEGDRGASFRALEALSRQFHGD